MRVEGAHPARVKQVLHHPERRVAHPHLNRPLLPTLRSLTILVKPGGVAAEEERTGKRGQDVRRGDQGARADHVPWSRKVDIRLPEKRDSNSHGARPVHQKHRWTRTSRLSIKNSLSPLVQGSALRV